MEPLYSRSRHSVVAAGILSGGKMEESSAGRVQHFQVGERAIPSRLEWDDGLNHPSIIFDDGLTASRAITLLLLPESYWETASLQSLQHPRALTLREVGVPSRIEWVSVRSDSDVSDNSSI